MPSFPPFGVFYSVSIELRTFRNYYRTVTWYGTYIPTCHPPTFLWCPKQTWLPYYHHHRFRSMIIETHCSRNLCESYSISWPVHSHMNTRWLPYFFTCVNPTRSLCKPYARSLCDRRKWSRKKSEVRKHPRCLPESRNLCNLVEDQQNLQG